MFITGFAMGSTWSLGIPIIFSNVLDDFVVRTSKNQKGFVMGAWVLLTVFTSFLDELVIAIVFTTTGFVAGIDTFEQLVLTVPNVNLVLWGIRLLVGVIPMITLLIGTLIFWKYFPLSQEKVIENKLKLKELGF
jgi:Na+/melibiose symporter-like transporter